MKFQKAFTLHQQGHWAQAQALYFQILEEQPQHVDALQLLGAIFLQTQQPAKAVEWMDKALALAPREPRGLAAGAGDRVDGR